MSLVEFRDTHCMTQKILMENGPLRLSFGVSVDVSLGGRQGPPLIDKLFTYCTVIVPRIYDIDLAILTL